MDVIKATQLPCEEGGPGDRLGGVLHWIHPEAQPASGTEVQGVYLGGDPKKCPSVGKLAREGKAVNK